MFLKVTVTGHRVLHGFDAQNQEILIEAPREEPMVKLLAIDKIKWMSEQYIAMDYAFGRVIWWEHAEGLEHVTERLRKGDLLA